MEESSSMQAQLEKSFYTPEEYLELEKDATYKSEYYDGEIVPMAGGTTNHNKISLNFCVGFKIAPKKQKYDIYMGDVRLWMERYRFYTYPDIMIIQGEPVYHGNGTSTVTNPLVIAEVLSPSTKDYDRSSKFRFYRSLPSFKEYILIDQDSFYVEKFSKNSENQWLFTAYESEDALLSLSTVDFQISLNDLYEGVNFAGSPHTK